MSVAGPPPSEILSLAVHSLGFGWYQPAEILKLSVKRVTQPQIYDNLNQPIVGGLYDHAMGPIEKHDSCVTCGLNAKDCLGHMGHIQLSLPVYHPLLFDLLYKLVKAKCFVCHKFRCNRVKLKLVLTKLRLLDAGLLLLAKSVDDIALKTFSTDDKKPSAAAAKKAKAKVDEDGSDDDLEPVEDQSDAVKNRLDELLAIAEKNIRKYGVVAMKPATKTAADKKSNKAAKVPGQAREPTSHEMSYRRDLVSSFFKEIQSKKCHSCGSFSPNLRRDGHTKVFRLPLTKVQQQSMDMLNLRFDDVLALTEGGHEKGSENWSKMMRERNFAKEYQAILRKKKEEAKVERQSKKKASAKKADKKNSEAKGTAEDEIDESKDDDDDDDADDADEADKPDSDDEADSDAESDDEDEEADEAKAAAAKKTGSSSASAKKKKDSKKEKDPKDKRKSTNATADEEQEDDIDDGRKVLIKVIDEDSDSKRVPILMFPTEVEKHLELLWKQEAEVLNTLWGSMVDLLQSGSASQHYSAPANDYRMFFLRVLCVPPSRFRPPTRFGDMLVDHPQNTYFKHILDMDVKLQKMQRGEKILKYEPREPSKNAKTPVKKLAAAASASAEEEKSDEAQGLDLNLLITTWIALQTEVNMLLDSTKGGQASQATQVVAGIRQTFEKKEGLFRRNMMGKRVNFAARSVISPDPFINVNEIGVPELFATQLSYPEPVTPFNVKVLRQAVINGPLIHPGANFVEDERGNLIDLAQRTYPQRVALSKTLLTTGLYDSARNKSRGGQAVATTAVSQKRVLRHVRTGDVMIVNRQPTLHKPSMMTHKVRVMRGRASKTQMKNAMWQTIRMHYANCNCYNADFDGDEMNLHVPQNELARAEAYHISNTDNQYVVPTDGSPLRGLIQDNVLTGVLLTKLDTFLSRMEYQQLLYSCLQISPTLKLRTPIPTILKPAQLWSGKQVIKGVLDLLTADRPALNLTSKAKVPASSWGQHVEEGVVIIRNNELLVGVLDKNQMGDAGYGLVHAVYELYGGPTSGELMSTLGRLFTLYLQTQGFTCGIDDMLLMPAAEANRAALKLEAEDMGLKAACSFAEIEYDPSRPREINRILQERMKADRNNGARLDGAMKSALNPFTSSIIQACLPGGQYKSFPANNMSMMTLSGAKGSSVNFSQISCLLGQQELEGRRVPMMATGKTLPSFRKYDPSPRAGGYVADRFLTGIKPQEYYHHCMAGREGLIDTAVKTSRSGYLQRCLIKHLESLVVNYDYTVRDADGSVVQFHYGEDSIDVTKSSYLDRFSFLTTNYKALVHKLNPAAGLGKLDIQTADAYLNGQIDPSGSSSSSSKKKKKHDLASLDPVLSLYNPGRFLGSLSERYAQGMSDYISQDPDGMFALSGGSMTPEKFQALMKLHYIACLVNPGESVGILAGQSIGEPSTQMTLNTFHLAGHGGANVTLGIPRLREIIMTASDKLKTPIMEVPLVGGKGRADAERIASRLNRLVLTSYLTNATCKESMMVHLHGSSVRLYSVRLNLLDMGHESVRSNGLNFEDFRSCFERQFCIQLNAAVMKQVKVLAKGHAATPVIMKGGKATAGGDRGEEAPIGRRGGGANNELDAVTEGQKNKHQEHVSYDDGDDEDDKANADMERKEKERADMNSDSEDEIDKDSPAATKKAELKKAAAKAALAAQDEADAATLTSALQAPQFNVLSKCTYLSKVSFDASAAWMECVVQVPLSIPKLLMMSMVENVLPSILLRATPKIAKSFVVEKFKPNTTTQEKEILVQTDGVNFQELYRHQHLFDVNRISSNDIAAILRTYGVEAARASIVREVTSVFKVYGISIDPRHLGLVADYMTFHGGFRPLNRAGIDSNPSPFQKISFETSIGFLMNACLHGDKDFMSSPSSRIVMGRPVGCGTGSFDVMNPLQF